MIVDARGRRCPLPVIDLARAILRAAPGEVVTVIADDPAAATDVPAWCRMRGHLFMAAEAVDGGATQYLVRKSGS